MQTHASSLSPYSSKDTTFHKAMTSHDAFFAKFRAVTKFYSLFHIIFWSAGFVQLLSILLFFSFFAQTTWSALALASLFLTAFSYLVLHFYFQTKKPQQFLELKEEIEKQLREGLAKESSSATYHIDMAKAYIDLSESLHEKETLFYSINSTFTTLSPLIQKFSIWLHWKDILQMKQLFLLSSINETISFVKLHPLDLTAHARLASGYLLLSQIYMDPKKVQKPCTLRWISPEYDGEKMLEKFHAASDRAIEELTIISEYAPSDMWTHHQLAKVYQDKNMPQLEIKAYESLHQLNPGDPNVLLRLGVLYFKEGLNSKGMKIYEALKQHGSELAEELINHYDSFKFHELGLSSASS